VSQPFLLPESGYSGILMLGSQATRSFRGVGTEVDLEILYLGAETPELVNEPEATVWVPALTDQRPLPGPERVG
jgi:hypothetical protein